MKISLGLAPSAGQTIPLSSRISIILAALANQTPNFLCRRVAEAFLVSEITAIAWLTKSSSSQPSPHQKLDHAVSGLLSNAAIISGL
jgi:hypothetical protein